MKRKNFIRGVSIMSAATMLAPFPVTAAAKKRDRSKLPGSLTYM